MKKFIALLLVLVMVLSLAACSKTPAETPNDTSANTAADAPAADGSVKPAEELENPNKYFTQFDEPFELHICYAVGSDAIDTLEGNDTVEDNFYTRWLLNEYNIKIVFDWTASNADYDQKLAMAISSDTLPDAWTCSPQYWKAAAKNGQLRDISEDYEKYVCDGIKEIYAPVYDRFLEACSYDGELSCLTGMTVSTEGVSVLMINQNWLDQLGLDVPKTLSDVEKVAKAFKEAKLAGNATVPILGPSNANRLYSTFNDSANCVMGLDAVFGAMGAYPGFFYEKDGGIVYGSLTQETRDALELLQKWYADGLLDPEIGIRTTGWEPINSNSCGMFFGQWWDIGFGNPASFSNDPNADWRAYPIYNDKSDWTIKLPDVTAGQRLCINANASDDAARAAIIVLNILASEDANDIYTSTQEDIAWYPLRLSIAPEDFVDRAYEHCLAVLNGEEDIDLYKGDLAYNEVWQSSHYIHEIIPNYTPGQELGRKDFVISDDNANWQAIYSWLIGDKPYATVEPTETVYPVVSYMTQSMELYWDNLESAEKSMMLSVITGEKDISAFDEFVEQWYAEGGQTILDEVAAEVG